MRHALAISQLTSPKASMTTYATRSPLQLLSNTHIMAETRRTTRRTSARLADKEDMPVMNGVSHATEKTKTNGIGLRSGKAGVNGATGGRGKRKHGRYPTRHIRVISSEAEVRSRANVELTL